MGSLGNGEGQQQTASSSSSNQPSKQSTNQPVVKGSSSGSLISTKSNSSPHSSLSSSSPPNIDTLNDSDSFFSPVTPTATVTTTTTTLVAASIHSNQSDTNPSITSNTHLCSSSSSTTTTTSSSSPLCNTTSTKSLKSTPIDPEVPSPSNAHLEQTPSTSNTAISSPSTTSNTHKLRNLLTQGISLSNSRDSGDFSSTSTTLTSSSSSSCSSGGGGSGGSGNSNNNNNNNNIGGSGTINSNTTTTTSISSTNVVIVNSFDTSSCGLSVDANSTSCNELLLQDLLNQTSDRHQNKDQHEMSLLSGDIGDASNSNESCSSFLTDKLSKSATNTRTTHNSGPNSILTPPSSTSIAVTPNHQPSTPYPSSSLKLNSFITESNTTSSQTPSESNNEEMSNSNDINTGPGSILTATSMSNNSSVLFKTSVSNSDQQSRQQSQMLNTSASGASALAVGSSADTVNSSNNMLRKLLNDDDSNKSSSNRRTNQELLAPLWKDDGQSSSSNQSSGLPASLSELISPTATSGPSNFSSGRYTGVSGIVGGFAASGPSSNKRKSFDSDVDFFAGSQPSTPLVNMERMESGSPVSSVVVNNFDNSSGDIGNVGGSNDLLHELLNQEKDGHRNPHISHHNLSASSSLRDSRSSSPIFSVNSVSGPNSTPVSTTNQHPLTPFSTPLSSINSINNNVNSVSNSTTTISSCGSSVFFKSSSTLPGNMGSSTANSTTTSVTASSSNDTGSSNNMLRKLLNDDDSSKSHRRNQEMLIPLWKDDGQSSSNQSSGLPTSLSELISPSSGSSNFSNRFSGGIVGSGSKRKSLDGDVDIFSSSQPSTPLVGSSGSGPKRLSLGGPSPIPQSSDGNISRGVGLGIPMKSGTTTTSCVNTSNQGGSNVSSTTINAVGSITPSSGNVTPNVAQTPSVGSSSGVNGGSGSGQPAQLAGSNPMLASMLAQTPKTLPVAPISIPTSIVSQVPQERLPKNLEKKLIHTPSQQTMIGITSSPTTPLSASIVVSSVSHDTVTVTSATTQQQESSTSSSTHMAISPQHHQPHPLSHHSSHPHLNPQQPQSQSQSQHPVHIAQQPSSPSTKPQIPHLPTGSQASAGQHFVITDTNQTPQQQSFRPLHHSQIQVQIVQSPGPRYQLRNVFTESQQTPQLTTIQQQQASLQQHGGAGGPICVSSVAGPTSSLAQNSIGVKIQSVQLQQNQIPPQQISQPSQRSSSSTTTSTIVAASSSTSVASSSASSTSIHSHVPFIDSISSTTSTSSSTSILASSSVLSAVQDTQDPLLSEILDQVWSMQQEMNIGSTQSTTLASAHSTTDDSMILDMLGEVLDPPPPNVSISATVNSTSGMGAPASPDLNEKLAISAIQRQLMSFENPSSPPHPHQPLSHLNRHPPPPRPSSQSAQHQTHSNLLASDRPPIFNQTGPLQQQPNFSNSPSFQSPLCPPPAYQVATTTRNQAPTQLQVHQVSSQQLVISQQPGIGPGIRRLPGPPHPNGNLTHPTQLIQHRAAHPQFTVTPGVVRPPLQQQPRGKGLNDTTKKRLYLAQQEELLKQQEKKLLAQQTQQEYTFSTPQDNTLNTDSVGDILNQFPPNVALQIKPCMGAIPGEVPQHNPRYSILNVGGAPSPVGVLPSQTSVSSVTSAVTSSSAVAAASSSLGQPALREVNNVGGIRPGSNAQVSSQSAQQPQSSYPSPSPGGGPGASPYGHPASQASHHRMSPHPYSNVTSPVGGGGHGPNSPAHLQMASPQPSSTSSPVSAPHGWPPPPSQQHPSSSSVSVGQSIRNLGPSSGMSGNNRMQQQNPMLNAQLSSGTFSAATAQSTNIRYTPQPPPTAVGVVSQRPGGGKNGPGGPSQRPTMTSPSPGPLHSGSCNSPVPQYPSSPGLFQSGRQTPVSSGMGPSTPQPNTSVVGKPRLLNQTSAPPHQSQPSRPQMLAAGVHSPRFVTRDESGNMSGSPYSTYPQPGTPVMDGNQSVTGNQFIFDNRSVSGAPNTPSTASPVSSEYVRQELRALVGVRSQQQQQHSLLDNKQTSQAQSQQPQQQPNQQHNIQITSSTSSNQSFTPADLEALGFQFDFSDSTSVVSSGPSVQNNCGSGSPLFGSMYDSGPQGSSSLATTTSNSQGSMGFGSSDNDNRSDTKQSSLLQQLLSSPHP
ncbi:uncharacterized protein LOC141849340 [Brevipalpus obovatus]|uniref:uncharacterized protein LOC141849340 n=1 Tax=Brevipalpus obovatus TaxID=246614 RepID=UPI003D9EE0EF